MILFSAFFIVFCLAFAILMVASQWKVFEKAGQPGWAAIIPIYNLYVLLKVCGKPGWWMVWMLVPIANLVVAIWMTNLVSKSFGKDEGFTVGLLLLGFVFWPVLAFGRSRYVGPYGDRQRFAEYQNKNSFDFEN
jgi:hypothetical protein